jgi:glycosyltransferase involved in cell wall biosynthesis
MPKVSVNIITYNRAKYLEECLTSIENQNYSDLEIILIDDASTDETFEVIAKFKKFPIKYFKNNTNKGIPFSRNLAISQSNGSFICILDSDDIISENRIEKSLSVFEKDANINLVCGFLQKRGETNYSFDNRLLEPLDIYTSLFFENVIVHSTVMVRKNWIETKLYNEQFALAEDYNLWIKSITCNNVKMIPEVFCFYSFHGGNISIQKADLLKQFYYKIVFQNLLEKFNTPTINLERALFMPNYFFATINEIENFRSIVLKKVSHTEGINKFLFKDLFHKFLINYQSHILNNFLSSTQSYSSFYQYFKNIKNLLFYYSFKNNLRIIKKMLHV